MIKKMLQFVDVKQESPEKRNTDKRKGDFNEIYKDYIKKMPNRIKNYFDIFGRSNVHITLLDDLKNDCELEYKKIIRFLGVDETFIPNFEIYNTNKKVKYLFIQKIIKMYGLALGDIRKRFWSNKPIGIIKR